LYYTASGITTPVGGRPVHRLTEDRLVPASLLSPVHAMSAGPHSLQLFET